MWNFFIMQILKWAFAIQSQAVSHLGCQANNKVFYWFLLVSLVLFVNANQLNQLNEFNQ